MKSFHSVVLMIVVGALIQYYFMSLLTANKMTNIENSLSKLYISLFMGLSMGVLEVIMRDMTYGSFSMKYYLPLIILLIVSIILYRGQFFVGDNQYLRDMIEHHSMALLTSKEILKKSHDYNVIKLAKDIINTQEEEIEKMKGLINA